MLSPIWSVFTHRLRKLITAVEGHYRNINGLKFYHSIRGNVEAYESPCIPSEAIVCRGHRYAPTVAIPTEVLTFFRAMFWALLHRCLTTYRFIYCPNYVLIGHFRVLKCAVHSLPRGKELLRAGVGILGQGHTPHSGSALA